jgi:REP element-mobilizing transposase RayT
MSRGNRKGSIFDDDCDRSLFMTAIADVARDYTVEFYAVCLMGNHYHAVLATPRGNLSEAMRQLNGPFTQASNRRHHRTGHLFEGRFRSIVVQRERYLRRVVRYVVRNPVRAGLVADARSWPWTTYRMTAGLESCPSWLTTSWMPWAFEADTLEIAQQRFQEYVNHPRPQRRFDWSDVAFGSRPFIRKHVELSRALRAHDCDRAIPRPVLLVTPPALDALFVADASREARDRMIEIAHVTHGYSLSRISRHLGFHAAMASTELRRRRRRDRRPLDRGRDGADGDDRID